MYRNGLLVNAPTGQISIMLPDSSGWELFWTVWGIAAFGVILKLFFTGRFEVFSTLLYLVMGWLIVFDFSTLADRMDTNGLLLLFSGGLFYTVGIVFYAIHKINTSSLYKKNYSHISHGKNLMTKFKKILSLKTVT